MAQTKQLLRHLCSLRFATNNRVLLSCVKTKRNYSQATGVGSGTAGVLQRIRNAVLGPQYKYRKQILMSSGLKMYVCCTELINTVEMMKELDLPDTFNSWFLITELHIWLCMVRLLSENEEGEVIRDQLIHSLWMDVDRRAKTIATSIQKKKAIKHYYSHLYNAVISYDEGLLGDDKELAGAIFRILFEMKDDVDPEKIALMVNYVRKQVAYLDSQNEETILKQGVLLFKGLKDDVIDLKTREKMKTIYNIEVKV